MRRLAIFFGILFLACFSATAGIIAPKHYQCEGDGVQAAVRVMGDGSYEMAIGKEADTLLFAPIDEIVNVAFGQVLSRTLRQVPDFATNEVSIILPMINMLSDRPVFFATQVVRSIRKTSIGGPSLVDGMITEVTNTYDVECMATKS